MNSSHPLYRRWSKIKERCYSPRHSNYKNYGGRGIVMCDDWKDSFSNFLEDMGECPDGYQIDRIDPDGNYCKDNCRWVSAKVNACNKRGSYRWHVKGSVFDSSRDAAKAMGVSRKTIRRWVCGVEGGPPYLEDCWVEGVHQQVERHLNPLPAAKKKPYIPLREDQRAKPKYSFHIRGVIYDTRKEAADAHCVSEDTINAWCFGRMDGKYLDQKPKEDCWAIGKNQKSQDDADRMRMRSMSARRKKSKPMNQRNLQTKVWSIRGEEYRTSNEAALAYDVSMMTIRNWVYGQKRDGRIVQKPRDDCWVTDI